MADFDTTHKRKYEDEPTSLPRRSTGFSAPVDSDAPPSYNNVPPPSQEFQIVKQKLEELASRALNADSKRSKFDNGSFDQKPVASNNQVGGVSVPAHSYSGSKIIEVPNGRVGVIIGKAGETIKYLQNQSGARIQITKDAEHDPNMPKRTVELMGSQDQIAKAEQMIYDVLAEADSGGSGSMLRRPSGAAGSEPFVMRVPTNKVGLVIGKGGETIKNIQARSGARVQVIPLHPAPSDTSNERTVQIDGTSEQIEFAKELVNEVIEVAAISTQQAWLILRAMLDNTKLNSMNFVDWHMSLRSVLKQAMMEYVLEMPIPEKPNDGAPKEILESYAKHVEDDRNVTCIMLATMEMNLISKYENYKAFDMIESLKRLYKGQARITRFNVLNTLMSLKHTRGTPISPHVMRMMDLIDDLGKLDFELQSELQTDIILGSLSSEFRGFIQNFNMLGLVKTNDELHDMLKIEEAGFKPNSNEVLMVKTKSFKRQGKGKPPASSVRPSRPRPASKPKGGARPNDCCNHCGELGHWRRNCKRFLAGKAKGSSFS